MLDIKRIKENPDGVKAGLKAKEVDCDAIVDKILELDVQVRSLKTSTETKTAEKNKLAKENGKLFGQKKGAEKRGEDTSALEARIAENMAASVAIDEAIAGDKQLLKELEDQLYTNMLALPNLPDPDLLPGGKENNEPLRYIGEKHSFDFEPKHHVDLCTDLGLIDYERGVKLAGGGNWMYTGMGARLEWALLNYFIDTHTADGYDFILPPHMLEYQCGLTAGQFPKFRTRSSRSPTIPPKAAPSICCPPPRLLWLPSTVTRSLPRPTCPRSSLLIPPASAVRPAPTVPTSVAWCAATSSTRWRCSSSPPPKAPTRLLKSW